MAPTTINTRVPGTGVDGHLCDTPTRRSDEVHVCMACLMWPMECARMPGPEPDTKWVGLMLSSHGCCVRSADTAVGERSDKCSNGDGCGSVWNVLECQELSPTRSGFTVPLMVHYISRSRMNVSVAWLLRVVWEDVQRAGGGVASALCDTRTRRSDEGRRASCRVLCGYVFIYLVA